MYLVHIYAYPYKYTYIRYWWPKTRVYPNPTLNDATSCHSDSRGARSSCSATAPINHPIQECNVIGARLVSLCPSLYYCTLIVGSTALPTLKGSFRNQEGEVCDSTWYYACRNVLADATLHQTPPFPCAVTRWLVCDCCEWLSDRFLPCSGSCQIQDCHGVCWIHCCQTTSS